MCQWAVGGTATHVVWVLSVLGDSGPAAFVLSRTESTAVPRPQLLDRSLQSSFYENFILTFSYTSQVPQPHLGVYATHTYRKPCRKQSRLPAPLTWISIKRGGNF